MTHGGCTCQPNPYPNPILRWMPPQANLQEYISRQSHKRETHTADRDRTQRNRRPHTVQQTTERPHDRKTYCTQNKRQGQSHAIGRGQGRNRGMKQLRRRGRVKVEGGRITCTTDNAGSGNPEERREASKPAWKYNALVRQCRRGTLLLEEWSRCGWR